MAISFEKVRLDFEQLRRLVIDDLKRVVEQRIGGNYAAGLIVVCGCEALARLWHGAPDGELVFSKRMLPEDWRPVGKSLYNALRNGLAHFYETKDISLNGQRVTLALSWRKHRHLSLSDDQRTLYLNVRTMARDLERTFDDFAQQLQKDTSSRDLFWTKRREGKSIA
jgi:hypothetical protein